MPRCHWSIFGVQYSWVGHLQIVDQIDAVLISHPDPAHIGALPYLVGKLKLNAPIYATAACYRMGELYMYDQALSWQLAADFETFSLDDVDAAFALVRQVKFQQNVKLKGADTSGILQENIVTYILHSTVRFHYNFPGLLHDALLLRSQGLDLYHPLVRENASHLMPSLLMETHFSSTV